VKTDDAVRKDLLSERGNSGKAARISPERDESIAIYMHAMTLEFSVALILSRL
jgi:hypothetical protein